MFLRRLNPNDLDDVAMLKIAFEWETEDVPVWWSNTQQIFGADTWEESLERSQRPEQIDIAVTNRDAVYSGLITFVLVAPKTFEFFFAAPRRSDAELLALACFQVGKQLLIDDGVAERLVSWVCARHHGAMRLNLACGMERTGLSMFKGRSHGKPLEWVQMRLTRERLQELIDGKKEAHRADRNDSEQSVRDRFDAEPVRLHDADRHARRSGAAELATAG